MRTKAWWRIALAELLPNMTGGSRFICFTRDWYLPSDVDARIRQSVVGEDGGEATAPDRSVLRAVVLHQ